MIQKTSSAFVAASWVALGVGMVDFLIGLWNATMLPSEKGFYAFAFLLAIFGAITVQKNTRDDLAVDKE